MAHRISLCPCSKSVGGMLRGRGTFPHTYCTTCRFRIGVTLHVYASVICVLGYGAPCVTF